MDFQPQIKYVLPTGAPMPFFMAYPDYPCMKRREESAGEAAYQDFEYLRRTYPAAVGKLQRRVEEILDRMDYEGSMIYDEFPDRVSLYELGDAVARILENEEKLPEGADDHYLKGLAQVLTCNEIYHRRRKNQER